MKKCNIVDKASDLASEVWAEELPDNFDPSDLHYNEILANIRHEFTNYQELLWQLPLCVDFENPDYCEKVTIEGYGCPLQEEAHDIIKWSAKEKAEQIYSKWLEKKKLNMKTTNEHMTKEEIEKKIKAKLKWEKFDNYELKITNRIAHCNICRHEIQKDEQRAIVNPQVVSRRYLTCLKCLKLLKKKNR
ncbi:MAG: hypothetical protein KAW47_10150 [Thermoplasmatales archaeon]|nr:hypothetical protein [Thermoplasmatales archaeon]